MASLAIPPVGRPWIPYISRPLYASFHGFDWGKLLDNDRPARQDQGHLRIFGAGFDYTWSRFLRYYMVSVGCHWAINVAIGRRYEQPADTRANYLSKPLGPQLFVELAILGLKFAWVREGDQPWRLRLFFRHRRQRKLEVVVRFLTGGMRADR